MKNDGGARRPLALTQGAYYLATGMWPLLSMRSFEAVTGPKRDRWLVKTVGVLVGVIGAVLLRASRRGRIDRDLSFLAAASAAGLTAIDTVYASTGRISRIYLLDALAETALVAAWAASRPRHGNAQ
jgi:hypothetical protein